MRRFTPALCVALLLAIPVVGIGMHEPGSAAPALAASMPSGVSPYATGASDFGALGTGGPQPSAAQAGAGLDALGSAPMAPDGQPRFMDSVVTVASPGIPVMEPPAVVASPASGAWAATPIPTSPSFVATPQPLPPPSASALSTPPSAAWRTSVAAAPAPGAGQNMVALYPTVPGPASPVPSAGQNMVALYPTVPGPAGLAPSMPSLGAGSAILPVPVPQIPGAAPNAAPAGQEPDPLAAWGPPPAPLTDPRRFTEAHWQGLELVPNTPRLAAMLQLPPNVPGVVVDDVTLPADLQGFQAGDLITHVAQTPTPHLLAFIRATERVRDEQQARVDFVRGGQPVALTLTALLNRLETANGDSPPMIPPGARMPHPYRGPCTNCHRIGTVGALAADQGDAMIKTAPDLRVGAQRPHEDRGPCSACHRILP